MPWLEKDNVDPSNNLLFVHVPRCGGTSLMKSHNVPYKATHPSSTTTTTNVSPINRLGLTIFFHRYKLLESTNFPIWTKGNAVCVAIFLYGWSITTSSSSSSSSWLGPTLMISSFIMLMGLTFIFVAPTIARIPPIRRAYLLLVQYPMGRMMESIPYITGTNIHGYLPHLTAHKMLDYGYVTPDEMETCSSLAIVRNPYSRMVSIYMYNRFGPYETFPHFIKSWYKALHNYREYGEMEEWYTHCHCIPQFEYCYFEGRQLVQSIVKQEELKYLKRTNGLDLAAQEDSSVRDLPKTVRDALLGMPHDNKRATTKPWYEYYDQETLDMTYEMYRHDFDVFEYSPILSKRPDLKPPKTFHQSISTSPSIVDQSTSSKSNGDTAETLDTSGSSSVTSRASVSSILSNLVLTTATKRSSSEDVTGGDVGGDRDTTPNIPKQCTLEKMQRDASASSTKSQESKEERHSLIVSSSRSSSKRSSMRMIVHNNNNNNNNTTMKTMTETLLDDPDIAKLKWDSARSSSSPSSSAADNKKVN